MDTEEKHKARVKQALTSRGIGSLMNNTKWRKIQAVMDTLPFPPPYQRKDVLLPEPEPKSFDSDVSYWGDWTEGIYPFYSIEWVRIRPRYLKRVAMLLPESLIDCEKELEKELQKIGQPYEKSDDSIWIYGYR